MAAHWAAVVTPMTLAEGWAKFEDLVMKGASEEERAGAYAIFCIGAGVASSIALGILLDGGPMQIVRVASLLAEARLANMQAADRPARAEKEEAAS